MARVLHMVSVRWCTRAIGRRASCRSGPQLSFLKRLRLSRLELYHSSVYRDNHPM